MQSAKLFVKNVLKYFIGNLQEEKRKRKKIETNIYNGNLGREMEDETEIHKWHIFHTHTQTHIDRHNTLADLFVSC